ncbi:HAMP domain-containing sensor histidine kinase [Jiangella muralis]|uniref:HAMP domain-containing sensor histidine kinase n=1 Tax=Jiangella muralis TaxID=702383 RepID=UPI00069EA2E3|nr:HAMP domain-containing sensor histidine kinase [Jiangella muralis]
MIAATAVAAAVVAAAVAAWLFARSTLMSEVDQQLIDQVDDGDVLGSAIGIGGEPDPTLPSAPVEELAETREVDLIPIGGQLVDADGEVMRLFSSTAPEIPVSDVERRLIAGEIDGPVLRTEELDGEQFRIVSAVLADGALVVQMSRSLTDVEGSLDRLAWLLTGLALAGVVVAAGVGWAVARTGLRPVDRLSAATERVALTKDLAHRIPVAGDDEIGRLSRSFNEMLEALDGARAQQRRLVDDAGHELATPLATLRNDLDLLLRAEDHPERTLSATDRRELLANLTRQSASLSHLMGEVLDLARGEAEAEVAGPADLRAIVAAAAELTARVAPDVRIEVSGAPVRAVVRRGAVERAVANLVRNAVQVSRAGDVVEVAVERSGSQAGIRVADRGPGLPDGDHERVFDRFYRGESGRGYPGSGLGLSIVAQVAAQHGGSVTAAGRPGGGTEFVLSLPLDRGAGAEILSLP